MTDSQPRPVLERHPCQVPSSFLFHLVTRVRTLLDLAAEFGDQRGLPTACMNLAWRPQLGCRQARRARC